MWTHVAIIGVGLLVGGASGGLVGLGEVEFSRLGITDGDVFVVSVERERDGVRASVVLDGEARELLLGLHSVRGDSFAVWAVDGEGGRNAHSPPPVTTYRGRVEGFDSSAAFSINGGEFSGVIVLETNGQSEMYAIEPLGDGRHVSYALDAVIPGDYGCGADGNLQFGPAVDRARQGASAGPGVAFDCVRTITIAFDADFEFFQLNGSDVDATIADIEAVINGVNLIFEDQMMLSHVMGETIVRTSADDPYTSLDSPTRLSQFQNEWNDNQRVIERDLAHLFTGVTLNGGAIGLGFNSVVCEIPGQSYGLSASRFSEVFAYRVVLTAHILGHNWDAVHCNDDDDCGIMCSGIDACPGGVEMFGQRSIDSIVAWAEAHESCLGEGPDCNGCPADLDGDGDADADDFFAYLDAFASGDLGVCDIDADGDCDAEDFFGYLDLFAADC